MIQKEISKTSKTCEMGKTSDMMEISGTIKTSDMLEMSETSKTSETVRQVKQ
jgi:hypothetical protein